MSTTESVSLPRLTPQQHADIERSYEAANRMAVTDRTEDALKLLLHCCKLDPANLTYRRALRRVEKKRHNNSLHGSRFAWITTAGSKAKLQMARRAGEHLRVLEYGELVLLEDPWDIGTQLVMAGAARELGMLDVAIWLLEQAREKDAGHAVLNRALAALFEQAERFDQAVAVWEEILRRAPDDQAAQRKLKNLLARKTLTAWQPHAAEKPAVPAPARPPQTAAPEPSRSGTGLSRVERETASLKARLEAEPTNPQLYLQLAAVYRRHERVEQARAVLRTGLVRTDDHPDLATELADLDLEPLRQARELAEQQLRQRPYCSELRQALDAICRDINRRELDLYRHRLDSDPAAVECRYELGVRLLRAQRIDEAILLFQKTREDARHGWRSLMQLGHCFQAKKSWRLARRNFEEALAHLPPREAECRKAILYELAVGLAAQGDRKAAVELGCEIANLDFGYRDIGRLLDEWQIGKE